MILLTFESDSVVFFQQRGGEMGRNSPPRLTVRNLSNGAWSESFQPADYTMRGIGEAQRSATKSLHFSLTWKIAAMALDGPPPAKFSRSTKRNC